MPRRRGRSRLCSYEPSLAEPPRSAPLSRLGPPGRRARMSSSSSSSRGSASAPARSPPPKPRSAGTARAEAGSSGEEPILQETGLAVRLGDWTLDAVSAALGRWRAAGLDHRLCFTSSARQFERLDFFERLRAALTRAGARPGAWRSSSTRRPRRAATMGGRRARARFGSTESSLRQRFRLGPGAPLRFREPADEPGQAGQRNRRRHRPFGAREEHRRRAHPPRPRPRLRGGRRRRRAAGAGRGACARSAATACRASRASRRCRRRRSCAWAEARTAPEASPTTSIRARP